MMKRSAILLLVALVVLPLGCSTGSDTAGDDTGQDIEWLFVQNADYVSLKDGVLTLDGISPTTLFFSDRPERVAAHGLTAEFVTFWGKGGGTDNFNDDPPNATLSIVTTEMTEDVVLTLSNPRLSGTMLQYDVTIIDGDDAVVGGPGSLFIDVVGRPLTPVSVAGTARRSTRRTVRRIAY